MKKGSVPVPYIIALLLGIAVIAILAYWFFFSGGKFGGAVSEAACRAKLLKYCTEWKAAGYITPCPTCTIKQFSTTCPASPSTDYYAPECCSYFPSVSVEDCNKLL